MNNVQQRFRFILDQVPEWWKQLSDVTIDVGGCIAIIPNSEAALPGDWIIREPDGTIRTESNEAGRIEARTFLRTLQQEVTRHA